MRESLAGLVLCASLCSASLGINASSHIEETTVESDFWDSFNVFADQRLKEKLLIILEVVLIGVAFLAAVMALAVVFLLIVSKCRKCCGKGRNMSRQQSQRPPHPSVLKMDI
ncbi:hypothetical protein PRIPAC_85978 [Pristionchus pacificus]|uniref:Uncharacterized protein n=1 Tax=Pristionchus pacificus TaxID=54126 RepID=A0A2A6BUY4_PRIPA|nr:hypothetical protein PRIPAC_85978 [Pristionchus pacificus]|eukprot:PDM69613.1 hypothetical protein PRIPAC_44709 [Pristionchus pacificus]